MKMIADRPSLREYRFMVEWISSVPFEEPGGCPISENR